MFAPDEIEFFGHTTSYWLELQRRAAELDITDWIEEVVELRGRVAFYESRLDQIERFRKSKCLK